MRSTSSLMVIQSIPLLRLIRKKLERAVTISTTWSVFFDSAIQMMVSRVLYRKWGLIWAWRARSSALLRFSCSLILESSSSLILPIMMLKLMPSSVISSTLSLVINAWRSFFVIVVVTSWSFLMGVYMLLDNPQAATTEKATALKIRMIEK